MILEDFDFFVKSLFIDAKLCSVPTKTDYLHEHKQDVMGHAPAAATTSTTAATAVAAGEENCMGSKEQWLHATKEFRSIWEKQLQKVQTNHH